MEDNSLSIVKEDNRYNKDLTKAQCYLYYFFIFAVLGWILETIYSFIVLGHFTSRGFLYGPICPIYGFGGLIMIIFLNPLKKKPVKLFFTAIVIFTIFEYITGYALDALYNLWLWDYRSDFLNLNGRIALFYCFSWGFIAIAFTYGIYPLFKKVITFLSSKINVKVQIWILKLISMIYLIDNIFSFIEYSKM